MNLFRRNDAVTKTPVFAQTLAPRQDGAVATLRLYDAIDSWGGDWGVSSKEFAAALDALPSNTSEIRLLINSPGGEVFEGIAILNALRAHPAKTTAVVEGIAASSASFIAAGCDELVMMQNSELFIHNAWSIVIGDAADMRSAADDLEQHFDRNIASIYAAKSGDDADHWLAEMSQDKFLTAEQAVEQKLADRIEGVGDATAARARFDLSVFDRSARAEAIRTPEPPSSPEPVETNQKEIVVANTNDRFAGVLDRLGVTDVDAPAEVLNAALDEILEQVTNPAPVAAAVPDGTTLIDSEVLASLQADAAQGREAREEQNKARREAVVDKALSEGRIAPAARATWLASLEVNEESTTALINSLATNSAVPVNELGHQPADASGDDAEYYALFPDERPNQKGA